MERLLLAPWTEFSRERGISREVDRNSQTEFPKGKCAFHLLVFNSSGPFGLDRLLSYLPGKSRGNGTSASRGNFHAGFEVCHLLQLSTNRFFQVNGKQPSSLNITSQVQKRFGEGGGSGIKHRITKILTWENSMYLRDCTLFSMTI